MSRSSDWIIASLDLLVLVICFGALDGARGGAVELFAWLGIGIAVLSLGSLAFGRLAS